MAAYRAALEELAAEGAPGTLSPLPATESAFRPAPCHPASTSRSGRSLARRCSPVVRSNSRTARPSRANSAEPDPEKRGARSRRRQAYLETLETIADQVGEFELAIARMANDPAMDVAEAPELLGQDGNRLGDVREMLRKARRDVIEA